MGPRMAAAGLCLVLAACQGKTDAEVMEAQEGQPRTAQLPAVAPLAADAPAGAGGVDDALAAVRAYNERAARQLAEIDQQEARIKAAVLSAAEAARQAETANESQRQALTQRVTAARRAADAARGVLVDGQARLRKDIDEQITAVEAMMETCGNDERLAVYPGCVALTTEHELLLKNVDALTARYQASDQVYGAERAKLEEASAGVALAALR